MNVESLTLGESINAITNAKDVYEKPIGFAISDGIISGDLPVSGTVDATGWLALPPFADVHAHIDKAFTWNEAGRTQGSLEEAVVSWLSYSPQVRDEDIKPRAERALRYYIASGVTAIRSHADFASRDDPLADIRALVELKHEYKDLIDLQVVPLIKSMMPDEYLYEAAKLDIDFLGGAPHNGDDPHSDLARIIEAAENTGLGVDIHTDEDLNPEVLTILEFAEYVKDWDPDRMRSASHCVSLSTQQLDRLDEILDKIAQAGISIVTNPQTNLFLQGWHHPVATPRGIAPLKAIRQHGIPIAAGGDNMQDPFNPLNGGDMLDIVALLIEAAHLDPVDAYLTASSDGRKVMGLPAANLQVGELADFILIKAPYLS